MADEQGTAAVLEAPGTADPETTTPVPETELPEADLAESPETDTTLEEAPDSEEAPEPTYTQADLDAKLKEETAKLNESHRRQRENEVKEARNQVAVQQRTAQRVEFEQELKGGYTARVAEVQGKVRNAVYNIARKAATDGMESIDPASVDAFVAGEFEKLHGQVNRLTGGAFAIEQSELARAFIEEFSTALPAYMPPPEAKVAHEIAQANGDSPGTVKAIVALVRPGVIAMLRAELEAELEREKSEAAEAAKLAAADKARTSGGRPSNVSGTAGKLNTNPTWAELQKMTKAQLAALPDKAFDAAMNGGKT